MKYYTGDEAGLIKSISFPPSSRSKKQKTSGNPARSPQDSPQAPVIQSWGNINKEREIQQMTWGVWEGRKHIVAARRNGNVELVNVKDGSVVKEWEIEGFVKDKKNGARYSGVFANESALYTLTSLGIFAIHDISSPLSSPSSPSSPSTMSSLPASTTHTLPANIERMRVHPIQNNMIAIGGKEVELTVYDLNSFPQARDPVAEVMAKDGKNKKKDANENGVVWKARNVPNDFLDLRVPIHIKDLQFISADATKLVVGTHYHQVRVYDTKAARRPRLNISVGENPIVALSIGRTPEEVVLSDTVNNVFCIDLRMGKASAQFKGFTGSVTALAVAPSPTLTISTLPARPTSKPQLVTTCLDRHLRIHDMTSSQRLLVHKVYLKQRLTCILVDDDEEEEEEAAEEAGDGAARKKIKGKGDGASSDDEVWEGMGIVGDNSDARHRHGEGIKRRR